MQQNLVIKNAYRFNSKKQINKRIDFENAYYYDLSKGFWIDRKTLEPYMSKINRPKVGTKKEDIETGEDRKGE